MQLEDLRPALGADLAELNQIVDPIEWRASLPSKLSDPLLRGLARDFRCVENALLIGQEPNDQMEGLAPALCVVMGLLSAHPARGGKTDSINISIKHLIEALQIYQFGLERELATRIIGIPAPNAERAMLEAFQRYVGV